MKLNIKEREGWYNTTISIVSQHGGSKLASKYDGSLSKLLSHVYPEYPYPCVVVFLYYI